MRDWTEFSQGVLLGVLAAVSAYYFMTYDKPKQKPASVVSEPPNKKDVLSVADRADVILW